MSWILEYFVVYLSCVYIYTPYICSAGLSCRDTYCSVVSTSMLGVSHMLSKTRRNSRSLHRVIAYICCIYFVRCLVYHMLFKTRRNSGSLHRVIGEVVVLGLLVVVYKIPYSSCIFNTAVVLEPGTMMCACLSGTGTL